MSLKVNINLSCCEVFSFQASPKVYKRSQDEGLQARVPTYNLVTDDLGGISSDNVTDEGLVALVDVVAVCAP